MLNLSIRDSGLVCDCQPKQQTEVVVFSYVITNLYLSADCALASGPERGDGAGSGAKRAAACPTEKLCADGARNSAPGAVPGAVSGAS